MISRVQVKNFRGIASADVTLGNLTVLVGRNGAGKSAFVDVLRFVRDAVQFGLESAIVRRQGLSILRRWSSRRPYDIEITLTINILDIEAEYGFVLGTAAKKMFKIKREFCRILTPEATNHSFEVQNEKFVRLPKDNGDGRPSYLSYLGLSVVPDSLVLPALFLLSPQYSRIRRGLMGNFYSIFPNTLRQPQTLSSENILAEDGSNLASVLRALLKDKKNASDILAALRRVVEGVSNIRVRSSGAYLFAELQHRDLLRKADAPNGTSAQSAPWLGLEQESDGTLRMLGMLVALYQKPTPVGTYPLLALEEPEIALHPGALAVLGDVIREISQLHQVIVTTQSPDFISRFHADELRVVERVEGVTEIGPLDSVQREVIVDQLFSAGDLLRVEGLRREVTENLTETSAARNA